LRSGTGPPGVGVHRFGAEAAPGLGCDTDEAGGGFGKKRDLSIFPSPKARANTGTPSTAAPLPGGFQRRASGCAAELGGGPREVPQARGVAAQRQSSARPGLSGSGTCRPSPQKAFFNKMNLLRFLCAWAALRLSPSSRMVEKIAGLLPLGLSTAQPREYTLTGGPPVPPRPLGAPGASAAASRR
jgi:hypothetical protein